jgi:hypothetical protein
MGSQSHSQNLVDLVGYVRTLYTTTTCEMIDQYIQVYSGLDHRLFIFVRLPCQFLFSSWKAVALIQNSQNKTAYLVDCKLLVPLQACQSFSFWLKTELHLKAANKIEQDGKLRLAVPLARERRTCTA